MDRVNMFGNMTVQQLQEQNVVLWDVNGVRALVYSLGSLDDIMQARLIGAIHSAVRITAAVIVGTVLALIARGFRSPLFILYQLNFLFMLISSALETSWIFSFNASITEYMSLGDIPQSSLNLSVAAGVFLTLLIMSLLASLVLQIYFSCADLYVWQQWGVTATAALGCFPAYLIWIWKVTLIAIEDLGPNSGGNNGGFGIVEDNWVFYGAWPSFAASTSFCSIILCIKLYLVQRKRTQMGIDTFNPMKVLLLMAVQNSALPAVLAIIAAGMNQNDLSSQSIGAAAIPLTAVLLPVGYIWAQVKGTTPNTLRAHRRPREDYENSTVVCEKRLDAGSQIAPNSASKEETYLIDSDKCSL